MRPILPLTLAMLSLQAFAQQVPPPPQPPTPPPASSFTERVQAIMAREAASNTEPQLTRFNLDFAGGTPDRLVAAIQKSMGKPLNAIIPQEHADIVLPPLKMNNVTVPELFTALERASMKSVAYVTSTYYGGGIRPNQSYQIANTAYGFSTAGTPTDDSIWYFRVEKPAGPPLISHKECRFYSLADYLENGLSVDDITTAIQTGWKMMGDKEAPSISFHKDTKLLIAVGEPGKLETIDAVLKALKGAEIKTPPAASANSGPKSAPAPSPKPSADE